MNDSVAMCVRKSNMELLRIISMMLIVLNHYVVNDSTLMALDLLPLCLSKVVLQGFSFGGGLGVNLFVLISGYFLAKSNPKKSKIIKLLIDVTLYSVILSGIGVAFGIISVFEFIKAFFPVIYPVWWFVTAYILLYIFSKYINIVIDNCIQKEIDKLILV